MKPSLSPKLPSVKQALQFVDEQFLASQHQNSITSLLLGSDAILEALSGQCPFYNYQRQRCAHKDNKDKWQGCFIEFCPIFQSHQEQNKRLGNV